MLGDPKVDGHFFHFVPVNGYLNVVSGFDSINSPNGESREVHGAPKRPTGFPNKNKTSNHDALKADRFLVASFMLRSREDRIIM